MERQQSTFDKIYILLKQDNYFVDKTAAQDYFTRLTGLFKNLNYTAKNLPDYQMLLAQIDALAESVRLSQ